MRQVRLEAQVEVVVVTRRERIQAVRARLVKETPEAARCVTARRRGRWRTSRMGQQAAAAAQAHPVPTAPQQMGPTAPPTAAMAATVPKTTTKQARISITAAAAAAHQAPPGLIETTQLSEQAVWVAVATGTTGLEEANRTQQQDQPTRAAAADQPVAVLALSLSDTRSPDGPLRRD